MNTMKQTTMKKQEERVLRSTTNVLVCGRGARDVVRCGIADVPLDGVTKGIKANWLTICGFQVKVCSMVDGSSRFGDYDLVLYVLPLKDAVEKRSLLASNFMEWKVRNPRTVFWLVCTDVESVCIKDRSMYKTNLMFDMRVKFGSEMDGVNIYIVDNNRLVTLTPLRDAVRKFVCPLYCMPVPPQVEDIVPLDKGALESLMELPVPVSSTTVSTTTSSDRKFLEELRSRMIGQAKRCKCADLGTENANKVISSLGGFVSFYVDLIDDHLKGKNVEEELLGLMREEVKQVSENSENSENGKAFMIRENGDVEIIKAKANPETEEELVDALRVHRGMNVNCECAKCMGWQNRLNAMRDERNEDRSLKDEDDELEDSDGDTVVYDSDEDWDGEDEPDMSRMAFDSDAEDSDEEDDVVVNRRDDVTMINRRRVERKREEDSKKYKNLSDFERFNNATDWEDVRGSKDYKSLLSERQLSWRSFVVDRRVLSLYREKGRRSIYHRTPHHQVFKSKLFRMLNNERK